MEIFKNGQSAGTKEGMAYVKNHHKEFAPPSSAYLIANEKTREAFHKLSGLDRADDGWEVRREGDLMSIGKWERTMF